ncbi:MAG: HEPN domain-containing protein [Candidatus Omnitrophica bacterium]|nr:HEPN domain-containing protein [Candidatus Omnitrophota bacterium]MBU4479527.1 HEPN domain-containing protein [Candidatus Omnitrophota bacterium]
MNIIKAPQEWIKQAEYDIETAQVMLDSERYIYCVFMSHLSIEKALKALYVKKSSKNPSKTHSLVYLAQSIHLELPERIKEFLEMLDEVSVPTRYPEELEKLLKEYTENRTKTLLDKSKEALEWLKKELEKQ